VTNQIYTGDCFEKLPALDENSVHAIVTDPPYGLAFMGRSWDDFEPKEYQAWCEKWATECLRVLKPGGHLLAFSGNRTHHRLMSGIEDAGYEIRDTITWHYGSGFPKALDVSKSIDKQADADREVIRTEDKSSKNGRTMNNGLDRKDRDTLDGEYEVTKPATEQAEQWDGFKSTLKPATEFVCIARSPIAEDTIAENVVAHGTGALNIDACRISAGQEYEYETDVPISTENSNDGWTRDAHQGIERSSHTEGRYPSNVVFDARQADVLDDEVGELSSGKLTAEMNNNADSTPFERTHGEFERRAQKKDYEQNSGGPSRYFYTSKASKAERTLDGKIDNAHPTVKPIDLMEWLVSLATAEEQIVLDPFAGSGTTCKAAKNKNRQFIGIEQQAKWADVARVRSGLPPDDHSHIRSDDEQHGLEQF